jgi:hypothetical protein
MVDQVRNDLSNSTDSEPLSDGNSDNEIEDFPAKKYIEDIKEACRAEEYFDSDTVVDSPDERLTIIKGDNVSDDEFEHYQNMAIETFEYAYENSPTFKDVVDFATVEYNASWDPDNPNSFLEHLKSGQEPDIRTLQKSVDIVIYKGRNPLKSGHYIDCQEAMQSEGTFPHGTLGVDINYNFINLPRFSDNKFQYPSNGTFFKSSLIHEFGHAFGGYKDGSAFFGIGENQIFTAQVLYELGMRSSPNPDRYNLGF